MHNLVREIFEKQLHRSCQDIQPFRDGLVSHVYAVTSGIKDYVIRLNQNFADAYRKEEWAMAQAAVVGVPVPALYGIGTHGAFDYMIMERIAGTVVTDYKGDMARLFHEVGRLASLINGIPVEGYGYSVDFGSRASPCFMETWQQTLDADAEMLFRDDTLIRLGALDAAEFKAAQIQLETRAEWDHPPHLSHNDISFDNLILGDNGLVYLIDWTLAQGQPAPYYDVGNFAGWSRHRPYLAAFLSGYGLNDQGYQAIKPKIMTVSLASALRAIVWAEKDALHMLPLFISECRKVLEWMEE